MALAEDRYLSDDYLLNNPTWDVEDSPWKAALVSSLIQKHKLQTESVCEIGCGAGGVLSELHNLYPSGDFLGYEIAPTAARFWKESPDKKVRLILGDFFALNKARYDLILLLDVIEHVPDPFTFLSGLHGAADAYIFHIPLDLSALSVLRETPILNVRRKVGHIHYFTKNIALQLLSECGFEVVDWKYSGAAFNSPRKTWGKYLAALPRGLAYLLNKDIGVRTLGGETLLVLARSAKVR